MAGCTKVYTKLDPIDAATVGRANTHKMLSWANAAGLVVFVALLTIPVDGKAEWLDDVRGAKGAKVEELYRRHLLELEACGLVISGRNVRKRFKHGRDWVRWWSSFFCVPKTDETSRCIFNGKKLSTKCRIPPNVNLLTQPEILRMVQRMMKQGKAMYFVECDLRHWFHQIPVHENLMKYFGLKLGQKPSPDEWYVWRCLPMGWSWSPVIAQAASWITLMWCCEKTLGDCKFKLEPLRKPGVGLPRYLETPSGRTRAVVYYDNVLVFGTHKAEADMLAKTLKTNVESLNVEIKGGQDGIRRTIDEFTYLGMEVKIKRESVEDPEIHVIPAKLEKWASKELRHHDTLRTYSSFVGRCVFFASLQNANLMLTRDGQEAIRLAREIGQKAYLGMDRSRVVGHKCRRDTQREAAWNRVVPAPRGLHELWDRVLRTKQEPIILHAIEPSSRDYDEVLATDAAGRTGWGLCYFNVDKNGIPHLVPREVRRGSWSVKSENLGGSTSEHIFYLELRAALHGLEQVERGRKVLLVVDNAAVAWVLRNGFCRTDKGMSLLNQYRHVLDRIGDICLVISADNPADCPSRGVDVEKARCEKLQEAIRSHTDGGRWASEREDKTNPWARYRHKEPEGEENILGPTESSDDEVSSSSESSSDSESSSGSASTSDTSSDSTSTSESDSE
jgi:hypothetical protein